MFNTMKRKFILIMLAALTAVVLCAAISISIVNAYANFLVFETDSLGTFQLLGDKTVNLTWAIILLSVVIALEIAAFVLVLWKRRRKNNDDTTANGENGTEKEQSENAGNLKVKCSFLPLSLLGAIVFTPVGAIGIISALGAVAAVLGGAIAVAALKAKRSAKTDSKKTESTDNTSNESAIESTEATGLTDTDDTAPTFASSETDITAVIEQKTDKDLTASATDVTAAIERQAKKEHTATLKPLIVHSTPQSPEYMFAARYNKSYFAKLILSNDNTKDYYRILKNKLLGYNNAKNRISWTLEKFRLNGSTFAMFEMKGKTLCVYLALEPNTFEESHAEEAKKSKKFADTPTLIKVKNGLRARKAVELIELLASRTEMAKGKEITADYTEELKTRDVETLVDEKLVKRVYTAQQYKLMSQSQNGTLFPSAEVAATVTPIETHEKVGKQKPIKQLNSVSVQEVADLMSDADAQKSLTKKSYKVEKTHRAIVNIGKLSTMFENGDTVTLASLKNKKLIPSNTTYYKVLASGVLNKALTVEAHDFSLDAVKMITLTGGNAVELK